MINRKRVAKIFMLFFVFLIKPVFAEAERPNLRWEYKHHEGETLMYLMKGEDGTNENNIKSVEAVLVIKIQDEIKGGIKKAATWTMKVEKGYEYMGYVARNPYQESIRGYIEINRDGNIEGIWYGSIFHLGLPRFSESGLDMWSRDIEVNENIGNTVGARIKFTGHYRKLMQEEIIKGRKCILFETEIGRFGDSGGEFLSIAGKARLELYAKTWFSPEEGRVIKIDSDLKVFSYHRDDLRTFPTYRKYKERAINNDNEKYKTEEEKKKALAEVDKKLEEMEKTGKTELEFYWDEPSVRRHFTYELLDEKEIKKLDGIEDDWELVLPGVNNFQLTVDGKIVFTKEETVKEKIMDSTGIEQEKEVKKSFIWISEGDGSGQRKLTEGANPVVSPDGKVIVYEFDKREKIVLDDNGKEKKIRYIEQKAIDMNGKENKEILENIDLVDTRGSGGTPSWLFSRSMVKDKIPNNLRSPYRWWSDKNKKLFFIDNGFTIEGRRFYLFDITTNKLIELPQLSSVEMTRALLSPTDLIFAHEYSFSKVILTYLSDDGEIVKSVTLGEGTKLSNWSNDGKYFIYFGQENVKNVEIEKMAYVYSIKSEKTIWETPVFDFNFIRGFGFSHDFKYIYFIKTGELTRNAAIYRIIQPKELQEKIAKGE